MSKIEKLLILEQNHSMSIEEIQSHSFASSVEVFPIAAESFEDKLDSLKYIRKILEILEISPESAVYFIQGSKATSSHFHLENNPFFIATYQLTHKQLVSCFTAVLSIKNIEKTREVIRNVYDSHHTTLDYNQQIFHDRSLNKYDDCISAMHESYGVKEIEAHENLIRKNLSTAW